MSFALLQQNNSFRIRMIANSILQLSATAGHNTRSIVGPGRLSFAAFGRPYTNLHTTNFKTNSKVLEDSAVAKI